MRLKGKYLFALTFIGGIASCQNPTESTEKVLPKEESISQSTSSNLVDTLKETFSWKSEFDHQQSLINHLDIPEGYERANLEAKSFAHWLVRLPLKEDQTVYLYNGEEKYNQSAQFKVIDIDVGNKDLQQCADAVMRLRAEYLYATKQYSKIHFNYTNGVNIPFSKWSKGLYPSLKGNKVVWVGSKNNGSYSSFRKYMDNIFMYAGTASLEKEMVQVQLSDIQAGDVFIKGGFPGHAVLVVDVVINKTSGDKCFLLAQSYMPAQNIHLLVNPSNSTLSPWYSVSECESIVETPEWTFEIGQLKRFSD